MVKNEIDVIEVFVRHSLFCLDARGRYDSMDVDSLEKQTEIEVT